MGGRIFQLLFALLLGVLMTLPTQALAGTKSTDKLSASEQMQATDAELEQWWQQRAKPNPGKEQREYERFRDLPAEKQEKLRQRWQEYQQMTPEQQQELQQRYRRWQAMSPEERKRLRKTYRKLQRLPEQQRQELKQDLQRLRDLPDVERHLRREELLQRYFPDTQSLRRQP